MSRADEMGSLRRGPPPRSTIAIPSPAYGAIAAILAFAVAVAFAIAAEAFTPWALLGFFVAIAVFTVVRRIEGHVDVLENAIEISTWRFGRRRRIALGKDDAIDLAYRILCRGKTKHEAWEVRAGNERVARTKSLEEARSIAEDLARALRRSMISTIHDSPPLVVTCDDLDLPLAARLRKYRGLRVVRKSDVVPRWVRERPAGAEGARSLRWGALSVEVLIGTTMFSVGLALVAVLICVLPGKRGKPSPFTEHGSAVFIYAFVVVALVWLAIAIRHLLTRIELSLDQDAITRRTSFALIPVSRKRIPLEAIEEIRVGQKSVWVVADEGILVFPTWRKEEDALWLAAELQHEVVERLR